MKTLNWKNLVVIIAVLIFCLSYCLANAGENYRCFAELYPEKAKQANVPALGGIVVDKGVKFRAVAEAKNPEINQWAHWVDVEPFDNVCDYAVTFKLTEYGFIGFKVYGCNRLDEIIKQDCKEKGFDFNKIKHFAEPIKIKLKLGTEV